MADDRDIWDQLLYFDAEEFGDNAEHMDEDLLRRLDRMRALAGIPVSVGSNYRNGDSKAHGRGYALDIPCRTSRARMRLVAAAIDAGFRRIGVYNHHIHVDVDPELPQDVMWWGTSS